LTLISFDWGYFFFVELLLDNFDERLYKSYYFILDLDDVMLADEFN